MLIEFCLPVYNEEQIIESNVLRLLDFCKLKSYEFDWYIIIIDNNSKDQTSKIADLLSRSYPNRIKSVRIGKSGKGLALKYWWHISEADVLAYMDIDLAVSLEYLDRLINPIVFGKYDLVIGSRLLSDSEVDRSMFREFNSRAYSKLSQLMLGHEYKDLQCGFKAAKTSMLKRYTPLIKNDKWFFDTEIVSFFNLNNNKILEIPVNWKESRYDARKSKMSVLRDGFDFLVNLLELRKRIRDYKRNI